MQWILSSATKLRWHWMLGPMLFRAPQDFCDMALQLSCDQLPRAGTLALDYAFRFAMLLARRWSYRTQDP
jgi:hypothetical protein